MEVIDSSFNQSYDSYDTKTMTKEIQDQNIHLKFAVLATDVVLFALKDNELFVRLITVDRPPAFPEGSRGFPGGLILPNETAEQAAARIIEQKADISAKKIYTDQLYTFSEIDRDPRGRVVAVSYIALTSWDDLSPKERYDGPESFWVKAKEVKGLAYDHDKMLEVALKRLQSKIRYTTVIGKLMGKEFTLGELERAYETILGEEQDKRNFRKKIAKLNILKELPYKQTGEAFRPARLYQFKSGEVKEIEIL